MVDGARFDAARSELVDRLLGREDVAELLGNLADQIGSTAITAAFALREYAAESGATCREILGPGELIAGPTVSDGAKRYTLIEQTPAARAANDALIALFAAWNGPRVATSKALDALFADLHLGRWPWLVDDVLYDAAQDIEWLLRGERVGRLTVPRPRQSRRRRRLSPAESLAAHQAAAVVAKRQQMDDLDWLALRQNGGLPTQVRGLRKIRRNTDWLYRHKVEGASFAAIATWVFGAESEAIDPERHVRRCIANARDYLDLGGVA